MSAGRLLGLNHIAQELLMHKDGGPAVPADGLVKHFTGRDGDVKAVRGVDLEVCPGEIFGFLGLNGAGKSTTVRMLTTLLSITSGRAEVVGVDATNTGGLIFFRCCS